MLKEQSTGDRFFEEDCLSLGYSVRCEPCPAFPRVPDFTVHTTDCERGRDRREDRRVERRNLRRAAWSVYRPSRHPLADVG